MAVGYDGTPVLRGLHLSVDMDDRIALLGANGNGKSTLGKAARRAARAAGGRGAARRRSCGSAISRSTRRTSWSSDETPIDHMARALPRAIAAAGARPARPLRPRRGPRGDAGRELSGGEKARLLLALATRDAPQLLLLDEPTNHLDIDAREALVKALADFEGAVLLITHDPHLVELVADRLWLVADGTVRPFDGDLDDYRALLAERARPGARAGRADPPRRPARPRRGARRAGAAAQAGAATPRRGWPSSPPSAPRSRPRWPTRRSTRQAAPASHRGQHAAGRDRTRSGGGRSRLARSRGRAGSGGVAGGRG